MPSLFWEPACALKQEHRFFSCILAPPPSVSLVLPSPSIIPRILPPSYTNLRAASCWIIHVAITPRARRTIYLPLRYNAASMLVVVGRPYGIVGRGLPNDHGTRHENRVVNQGLRVVETNSLTDPKKSLGMNSSSASPHVVRTRCTVYNIDGQGREGDPCLLSEEYSFFVRSHQTGWLATRTWR